MVYLRKGIQFLVFVIVLGVSAQDSEVVAELITDRPDATESPNAVPKKSIQLETGGFYETFKENGTKIKTLGYNTTLIRYGLLENFELRLGWNFEEIRTSVNGVEVDNIQSGFSPLLAGMKVEFVKEKGILPNIGLLVHLMLPFTAGKDYRPDNTGVDFRLAFAHTLTERSGIAYNLGAQWGDASSDVEYVYTLAYGYSLLEKLGIYAEIYGDFTKVDNPDHLWDAGLTYLICDNMQMDATIGKSFTKGQDILLSAGFSIRIPK